MYVGNLIWYGRRKKGGVGAKGARSRLIGIENKIGVLSRLLLGAHPNNYTSD